MILDDIWMTFESAYWTHACGPRLIWRSTEPVARRINAKLRKAIKVLQRQESVTLVSSIWCLRRHAKTWMNRFYMIQILSLSIQESGFLVRGCELPAKLPSLQERFERRQARRTVKKVGRLSRLCLFDLVCACFHGDFQWGAWGRLGMAAYTRF